MNLEVARVGACTLGESVRARGSVVEVLVMDTRRKSCWDIEMSC